MKEIYQEILSLLRQMWRYRMHGLGIAWIVAVIGVVGVMLQRDVYEATARVYVNTASQLRVLLGEQIVESNVEDQLRYVREAMLGRPQLEKLALEVGFLQGNESEDDKAYMVAALASNIQIVSSSELSAGPRRFTRNQPTDDTYLIRYHAFQRSDALRVVDQLLKIFVDDTLGAKKSSSRVAGDFLQAQIRDYEMRLQTAEAALAEFNRRNYNRLPNLQGGYFQQLQSAQEELEESERDLDLAYSRLRSIESQMRGESPRISAFRSGDGQLDPNSIEARVLGAERELSRLRLRFTDQHPDVIAAAELLAGLKSEMESIYANTGELDAPSNNPVFQALQISRNELKSEIATMEAVRRQKRQDVEQLQSLIGEMPEVEAELSRLNRDYNVVHDKYQALLASLERENLSREVVESEEMEFRIIDPPAADFRPVAPRRGLFLGFVLMLSVGAGLIAAYIMSQMNLVFDGVNNLARITQLPVLGSISVSDAQEMTAGQAVSNNVGFLLPLAFLVMCLLSLTMFEMVGPGLRALF